LREHTEVFQGRVIKGQAFCV